MLYSYCVAIDVWNCFLALYVRGVSMLMPRCMLVLGYKCLAWLAELSAPSQPPGKYPYEQADVDDVKLVHFFWFQACVK